MRCGICDSLLEKIVVDKRTGKVEPCPECLEAVATAEWERLMEELENENVDQVPGLLESDEDTGTPEPERPN